MSYFLISAGRVAMGTVQYHSASPPNALRLSHHPVWRGNPVHTLALLQRAVDIWTHAIFLILLLCRRADTQRCDVSTPPTWGALKSPGNVWGGGVFAVGALWMSCTAAWIMLHWGPCNICIFLLLLLLLSALGMCVVLWCFFGFVPYLSLYLGCWKGTI